MEKQSFCTTCGGSFFWNLWYAGSNAVIQYGFAFRGKMLWVDESKTPLQAYEALDPFGRSPFHSGRRKAKVPRTLCALLLLHQNN